MSIRDRVSGLRQVKALPAAVAGRARRVIDAAQAQPRKTVRVLTIAAIVMVVLSGLSGLATWHYHQLGQARDDATLAAKDTVVQVLSYNFRTIDRQVADTEPLLTGKFKDEYSALVRDVVAQAAKDTQVSTQTTIVNTSVVSSDSDHMVLLVFVNQQSQNRTTDTPELSGSRLRVAMEHQDGKWLLSELTPV